MPLMLPSPLERVEDERLEAAGVRLFLKRDDLIHPDFPGNKWRKLKYNLRAAERAGKGTLLTFGGAYSNHLRATAAAGFHFGFATVGVVRGEEHTPRNPVLARAEELGMTLVYVDRGRYREKSEAGLRERFGDYFLIPEGGANSHALAGCAELPGEIDIPYDVLCCASGTGATLAGIATALPENARAVGFAVLKGDFLDSAVARLQAEYGTVTGNWSVVGDCHFGGFAKRTAELDAFIEDFRERHGITLDGVYEAKMMAGIVERGGFAPGTTVVAVI